MTRVVTGSNDPIADALRKGIAYHQKRQLQQAEAIYREVLARHPGHPQALYLLGVTAMESQRFDAAAQLLRQASVAAPLNVDVLHALAGTLAMSGRIDQAIATWNKATSLKPDFVEAWVNLGVCHQRANKANEAIACYRRALAVKPDFAAALSNLAGSLYEIGQLDEAIETAHKALSANPNDVSACRALGLSHHSRRHFKDAVHWYRRAVALDPTDPDMHSSLGGALQMAGEYEEAEACIQRALKLDPDHGGAHFNRALLRLLHGEYTEGWKEYQWRWKCKNYAAAKPDYPHPEWDGSDLGGKTILLHAEQGFGDAIQFIRYVPLVVRRGGRVIVGCPPPLKRLFGSMPGVADCRTVGEPLPPFDCHCPLLTLPWLFGTTLATIPVFPSYLQADPGIKQRWSARMGTRSEGLRVGLAWASGHGVHDRLFRLADFAPLAVDGVRFFSLQKGPASVEAVSAPAGMELVDWTSELNDFADTAGLVANLDLVISVDTVILHVAGALGRPVWTVLDFVPEWRWLLDREDSPWYPSMRLFRESVAGDRAELMSRVRDELSRHLLQAGHTS